MSEVVKQSTKGMHIYDVYKKLHSDPLPTPLIRKNEKDIYCLKTTAYANT